MLLYRNLERLIGTALIDGEFGAALLRSPVVAASGFDLSSEEMDVLNSANADTLEDLAAHIHAWITRVPKPRRTASHRWTLDDYQDGGVAV